MDVKPVKVALIGSGNISYTYLNTLTKEFSIVEVVGCSDLIPERSKARSELFGVRQMTNEEILSDPEIEIVVNTTNIEAHTAVTRMILEAGKNAYSEKMMGRTFEEAKANVDLAKAKGLRFGSAPDTYLGSAYQTARKLIDDGYIGTPMMAQAICYRPAYLEGLPFAPRPGMGADGTTIPFDMGGYYVNALVNLLGPVKRATGYARSNGDRLFTNPLSPLYKKPFGEHDGPSMMMGCLEFVNGCYGNLVLMSEGFNPEIPRIEIFGTKGTLVCPDPNYFGGYGKDVYLTRIGNEGAFRVPFTHGYSDTDPAIPPLSGKREPCHNSHRGMAVADMAWAIRRGRPHRSSADLALHAVEIVTAIEKSSRENVTCTLTTRPERPAPLAPGFFGPSSEAALDF